MANCAFGSELRPGVPDALVRVRRTDFTPTSLPSWVTNRRPNWGIDIADLLAPENVSTYGVLYEGDLLSRFCAGPPPTQFPNYPIGDQPFLSAILNAVWNENCQCKKPPVADCCSLYGGRGQQIGVGYQVKFQIRRWSNGQGVYLPPVEGSVVAPTDKPLVGGVCNYRYEERPSNRFAYVLSVANGTPNPYEIDMFGGAHSITGRDPLFLGIISGYPLGGGLNDADFCIPPVPPNYDESGLQGTIRNGSRPGIGEEATVVIIQTPGMPGRDGIDGTNGTNGLDGRPGLDGQPGNDGAMGVPGANGTDGSSGADGTPGERGIPGVPGQDGTPGEPGIAQKISIRNVARVALGVASFFSIVSETEAAIVYDLFLEEGVEIDSDIFSVPFCNDDGVELRPVSVPFLKTADGDLSDQTFVYLEVLEGLMREVCDGKNELVAIGSPVSFEFESSVIPVILDANYVEIVSTNLPALFSRTKTGNETTARFAYGEVVVLRGADVIKTVDLNYRSQLIELPEFATAVGVSVLPVVQGVLKFYNRKVIGE